MSYWPLQLTTSPSPIEVLEEVRNELDKSPYPIRGEITTGTHGATFIACSTQGDEQRAIFSLKFGRPNPWPCILVFGDDSMHVQSCPNEDGLRRSIAAYNNSPFVIEQLSELVESTLVVSE